MNHRPTKKQLESYIEQVCEADDFDCRQNVMDQIHAGKTKMRSRWVVLTEELGLRTTWILAVFLLIALINLTIYMFSRSPEWEFLDFGGQGWSLLIKEFPYGLVSLALIVMVFCIYAMKQFSWSYLFPFKLFSVLLVTGIFLAGGVAFATGINDTLYHKLIEEPGSGDSLLAKLYCLCTNRDLNSDTALLGEMLRQEGNEMVVQTPDLQIVQVKISPDTIWMDETQLASYSIVKMLGARESDTVFTASHIKVHQEQGLELIRSKEDCENKQAWDHKREVAEKRRQAVLQPFTPIGGVASVVKSIY